MLLEKAKKTIEDSQPTTDAGNVNLCSGGLEDKDKYCTTLASKDNCGKANCCVWARKKNSTKIFSCVGGDEDGATYNGADYDAYYYNNKRFPASDNEKTTN